MNTLLFNIMITDLPKIGKENSFNSAKDGFFPKGSGKFFCEKENERDHDMNVANNISF